MTAPRLSVVIPAFDEALRLPATMPRVLDYLDRRSGAWEIIVVDDGSRDGTPLVAAGLLDGRANARVLSGEPNRGKGYAVRRGMLAARGRLRLFSDADLSTPIEDVERLERAIDEGADVAVGSRRARGSDVRTPQPLHRLVLGRGFSLLVRGAAVGGVRDTQCGFKLFTEEAAQAVFSRLTVDGFAFDVEALFLARRLGFAVAEVAVTWVDAAGSKVRPARDALRMLRAIGHVRLRAATGRYR